MNSKLGSVNSIDWKKVGVGLLVALGGALATWLEQDLLKIVDFGQFQMIAVAVNSALVNLLRKWLSDQQGNFLGIGSKKASY